MEPETLLVELLSQLYVVVNFTVEGNTYLSV
jgi:hypothetical protein